MTVYDCVAQVFISHAEEDAEEAAAIAEGLEDEGYSVWRYQKDSLAGLPYLKQISDAIQQAAVVIVILSMAAFKSRQVAIEVVRAHELGRHFVPLLKGLTHDEFRAAREDWALAMGDTVSVRLPDSDVQAFVARLTSVLRHLNVRPGVHDASRPTPRPTAPPLEGTFVYDGDSGYAGVSQSARRSSASALRRLQTLGLAVAVTVVLCAAAGFVTTRVFNSTLGRSGEFAAEPPLAYVGFGAKALFPSVIHIAGAILLFNLVGLAAHLCGVVCPPLRRATHRVRTVYSWGRRVGLDEPNRLAQALSLFGLVGVIVICWRYQAVLAGVTSRIDQAPIETLVALHSSNQTAQFMLPVWLEMLMLVLGIGIRRIVRVQREQKQAVRLGPLSGIVAVLGIALTLVVAPWRVLWDASFPEVTFDGQRCFLIGAHGEDVLVHCPELSPRRNQRTTRSDPKLTPTTRVDDLFDAFVPRPSS